MKKRMLFAAVALFVLLGIAGIGEFKYTEDAAEGAVPEEPDMFRDIPRKGAGVVIVLLGAYFIVNPFLTS
jgi:hypothetical protein